MKLSVFYDHILQAAEQSGKPVTEILQEVRTAGVEAVEISLPSLSESEQTCKLLRDAHVNISCVYELWKAAMRHRKSMNCSRLPYKYRPERF